jgi:hypothetical protein
VRLLLLDVLPEVFCKLHRVWLGVQKHSIQLQTSSHLGITYQQKHRFKASSTRAQCASGEYNARMIEIVSSRGLDQGASRMTDGHAGACPSNLIVERYWLPGPTLLTSPTLYSAFSSVRVTPTCITAMGCEPASQVQAEQPSSSACCMRSTSCCDQLTARC